MADRPGRNSDSSEFHEHPRFEEYLQDCNNFWTTKQTAGRSATFPTFPDWLADTEKLKQSTKTASGIDSPPQSEIPKTDPSPEQKVKTPNPEAPIPEAPKEASETKRPRIPDDEDPFKHPRFQQWLNECEIISEGIRQHAEKNPFAAPLGPPPPFYLWLKLKQEDEIRERNRPRIRSANPPRANIEAAKSLFNKLFRPGYVERLLAPFTLHAYPTEFTLLLADNSTVKTTVHFQIPADKQILIEQLNHVTSKELLIFAARKHKRPTATELQNHLHLALVEFQNENDIAVLRVEISANIHFPKNSSPSGGLYV